MQKVIKSILKEKGIDISDHILQEVTARWEAVNMMKNQITDQLDSTGDLALRNIPRGDYN